ncbi:MAG: hypothetical protein ACRYF3_17555, partial [Janthinobacterium lividum]
SRGMGGALLVTRLAAEDMLVHGRHKLGRCHPTGQLETLGNPPNRAGRPAVAISYDTTGKLTGQER